MGDRFYQQQGLSVSDFAKPAAKPTKAVLIAEIVRVLPFFDSKTLANTTNVEQMLQIRDALKTFAITGGLEPSPKLSNRKQPYVDYISANTTMGAELLGLFSVKGLSKFSHWVHDNARD